MTTHRIFVDADACPVKKEVCRVAARHALPVIMVANSWMRIPGQQGVRLEVVGKEADAADNWIAENVAANDLVITTDVPLAGRCVDAGAHVISPSGKRFTEDNIGGAVADRNLMSEPRAAGLITGGPPPLQSRDRSTFLQSLNDVIQKIQRR